MRDSKRGLGFLIRCWVLKDTGKYPSCVESTNVIQVYKTQARHHFSVKTSVGIWEEKMAPILGYSLNSPKGPQDTTQKLVICGLGEQSLDLRLAGGDELTSL